MGAITKATDTAVDTAQAPANVPVATVIRKAIEQQSTAFAAVLPKGVDRDRFSRLVLTACKATPQLIECFSTKQGEMSVLLAAMQAAAIGLEPNTPTQDCWLTPRKNKGTMEAQLSIGYRGYLRLARRSGTVRTIYAEVVRQGDEFHWERGLEQDVLRHVPGDGTGELTHCYAVARYTNGGYSFIVLDRAQVEARRARSDSWRSAQAFSPWTTSPEAMWRKSAIRALVPFLSPEFAAAVAVDERPLALDDEAGIIAVDVPELGAGGPS
jgi:recombination protein RecT